MCRFLCSPSLCLRQPFAQRRSRSPSLTSLRHMPMTARLRRTCFFVVVPKFNEREGAHKCTRAVYYKACWKWLYHCCLEYRFFPNGWIMRPQKLDIYSALGRFVPCRKTRCTGRHLWFLEAPIPLRSPTRKHSVGHPRPRLLFSEVGATGSFGISGDGIGSIFWMHITGFGANRNLLLKYFETPFKLVTSRPK